VVVTFLTPLADAATLRRFYSVVRLVPAEKVVGDAPTSGRGQPVAGRARWVLGCTVYAALFGDWQTCCMARSARRGVLQRRRHRSR
jgi:hypothetical protein